MDQVVVTVPEDLNFAWLMAHMAFWCPYSGNSCSAFEDPLVRGVRETSGVSATQQDVQVLWTTLVNHHAQQGPHWSPSEANATFLQNLVSGPLRQAYSVFTALWNSPLGIRVALEFWERGLEFGNGRSSGEPSVEEWRQQTPIRAINVVGTEDAVYLESQCLIAGALATRSLSHLLDKVRTA
jgi:hypothetical protein